jgi:hypothetical protein
MEQQSVRKTYKYRLDPTPEHEKALGSPCGSVARSTVSHALQCRTLYHVALEQRKLWWERGQGVGASYYQQKAELPGLKAACPEVSEIHAHVLQDGLLRLDRTFQAFFGRVKAGETPGYPRFQGRGRSTSFTFPEYGNGAVLDGRVLSLSKIGRIHIRLHRPLEGRPRPLPSAGKRMGGMCVSLAPRFQRNHSRSQDTRPGSTLALSHSPRCLTGPASSILAGTARPSAHSRPRSVA